MTGLDNIFPQRRGLTDFLPPQSGLRGPTLPLSPLNENGKRPQATAHSQGTGDWDRLDDDASEHSGPTHWGKLGV